MRKHKLLLISSALLIVGIFMLSSYGVAATKTTDVAVSEYKPSELKRYSWGNETATLGNPFTSLLFRKAFAMSFDYDTFINNVTNGFAERMEGVIPNGMFGHHDQLIEKGLIPEYNPDAAKAIFQQVGWRGTITLGYNAGNEVRKQGCLLLKSAIESMDAGIRINVREMEWPDYLSAVRNRELPIFFLGWAPDYADPDNYAAPFLHGEYGIYAPRLNYNNPMLNELIENASKELNVTKREQMYHQIEEMAASDYPFIYGYQAHRFTVLRSWIHNYNESGSLNPMSSFANVEYLVKEANATNPGKFIVETIGEPDPIDPATNYESFGSGLNELVYETLVDYKGNSATELEGKLAVNWTVSDDGKQYNFTLRQGVTFSDNTPFNAYVMKYSLDRAIIMMDPFGPAWMIAQAIKGGPAYMSKAFTNGTTVADAIDYLNAGGIKVIDEYTLQINLEFPYTPFLYALAYRVGAAVSPKAVIWHRPSEYTTNTSDATYGMVPLDEWFPDLNQTSAWDKLGLDPNNASNLVSGVVPSSPADGPNKHTWMATHAVGTGPFVLGTFDPATEITFTKNTNWWGNFTTGSPDEIIIKKVNEVDTRIQDLKEGQADSVYVPTTHASEVQNDPNLQIFTGPTFTVMFFGMNMNNTLPAEFIQQEEVTVTTTTTTTAAEGTETTTTEGVPGFELSTLLAALALGTVILYETKQRRK